MLVDLCVFFFFIIIGLIYFTTFVVSLLARKRQQQVPNLVLPEYGVSTLHTNLVLFEI